MTGRSTAVAVAVVLASLALGGCVQPPPRTQMTRAEVVGRYNADAGRIDQLWARAKIALAVRNDEGRLILWGSTSPLASPNGLLVLSKDAARQADFALIGRQAGTELFRLGSGPRGKAADEPGVYYVWYNFGDYGGQAYWGLRWLAGAEGVESLPLDPLQLLGVLGVVELPADFTQLPTVAMTLQDEPPYAYVLTYVDRQPLTGHVVFRRRVYLRWSDTEPPRPFRMDLIDNTGRTVMVANMSDYQPVDLGTGSGPQVVAASDEPAPADGSAGADAPADRPMIPTDIQLSWPQQGGRIRIVLSEMSAAPGRFEPEALVYDPPPALRATQEQVDLPLLRELLRKQGEQP